MTAALKQRVMSVLPESMRAYQRAVASSDKEAEEQCQFALCSALQYLLEAHLSCCVEWSEGSVVDGVLPGPFEISASGALSLAGLAVWYHGHDWFLDPIAVHVELSADHAAVRSYSLRFGDAESGLRKFPLKPVSKELFHPPPDTWCFVFDEVAA